MVRPSREIPTIPNLPSSISTMGSLRRPTKNTGGLSQRPLRTRPFRLEPMLHRRDLYRREKGGFGVGNTKRGKGTKLMAMANRVGLPFAIHVTSAAPHEVTLVHHTLKERFLRTRPEHLIGDRAYDCDPLDAELARQGIELIAPHKENRKKQNTQDGRALRRYKNRWKIERLFAWLHNFRRLVVRYDYRLENYLGFVHLACITILLKNYL